MLFPQIILVKKKVHRENLQGCLKSAQDERQNHCLRYSPMAEANARRERRARGSWAQRRPAGSLSRQIVTGSTHITPHARDTGDTGGRRAATSASSRHKRRKCRQQILAGRKQVRHDETNGEMDWLTHRVVRPERFRRPDHPVCAFASLGASPLLCEEGTVGELRRN